MDQTTKTLATRAKRHSLTFSMSALRTILPAAARAFSGEEGEQVGELVCYCPRVCGWFRVVRIIPNGTIRYSVLAIHQ